MELDASGQFSARDGCNEFGKTRQSVCVIQLQGHPGYFYFPVGTSPEEIPDFQDVDAPAEPGKGVGQAGPG